LLLLIPGFVLFKNGTDFLFFVWERREVHTGFWWGNLREREPLGRSRRRWEDNINTDLQAVG
jgi:hypothetical protein